eukprot:scaffold494417_cov51-Prasinocladus_malaysianus.AAC.1
MTAILVMKAFSPGLHAYTKEITIANFLPPSKAICVKGTIGGRTGPVSDLVCRCGQIIWARPVRYQG